MAAGRWAIRYTVAANYGDEVDPARMRELNQAAAEMKRVFDPHVQRLEPQLEEDYSEPSSEAAGTTDGSGPRESVWRQRIRDGRAETLLLSAINRGVGSILVAALCIVVPGRAQPSSATEWEDRPRPTG